MTKQRQKECVKERENLGDKNSLFDFEGTITFSHSGGNDGEDTPVPIPNTAVKLSDAEDSWLATARENMKLPDYTETFW